MKVEQVEALQALKNKNKYAFYELVSQVFSHSPDKYNASHGYLYSKIQDIAKAIQEEHPVNYRVVYSIMIRLEGERFYGKFLSILKSEEFANNEMAKETLAEIERICDA